MKSLDNPHLARSLVLTTALSMAGACAHAQRVSYADDPASFLVQTQASSIGALTAGVQFPWTVGRVTFENPPFDPAETYQPNGGFSASSNEFPGASIAIGNRENFDIRFAGGTTAFGLNIHEPVYLGSGSPTEGCAGTPCLDSTFRIEIFSGSVSLGAWDYNPPGDDSPDPGGPLGFFGVYSSTPFDSMQVRELGEGVGYIDNEYFGNFLISAVPEPSTWAVWLGGLALVAIARRR